MDIPSFVLRRTVVVAKSTKDGSITFSGIDSDGTPLSFMRACEAWTKGKEEKSTSLTKEPFTFSIKVCIFLSWFDSLVLISLSVSVFIVCHFVCYSPALGFEKRRQFGNKNVLLGTLQRTPIDPIHVHSSGR